MDIRKCCDLLDLRPGYSQEDLKQAYKDLVQVWHPDRFSHSERLKQKAESKLKQINLAYEVLDQALVKRAKLQAHRAAQSMNSPESVEEQIVRSAYEQSVAWGSRPGQRLRFQLSIVLWSVGMFGGLIGLIAMLAWLSSNLMLIWGAVVVVGGYFGLRWFHEQQQR
ncbi:DnaJ domain-containing protein [filamentous cyanobacterium LEGE 11480]|uniref:DnaJ domain-containing protein n=1 Tax=Romeriopsis navalis LEGE 11480 TaxID=2777977 RepID=A0A928Z1T6_9CYAN|nr:DnaJ domain-containing protein [Romeriopsis navalis]MBE9028352.1 DnaJ domain-containing protein [Romeriopsis navalis LEGE 11480]